MLPARNGQFGRIFCTHFIKIPVNLFNVCIFGLFIYPYLGLKAGLVYGQYGCSEDFDVLRANNVNVTGALVLLRAGKISFSEKVTFLFL